MDKPRPSPNFGKRTATTRSAANRPASIAGSSVGSSTASGGEGWATTRRSLIKVGIDVLFEGLHADAMHHVDETFGLAVAQCEVNLDQALDHVGHVGAGKRRTDNLP